MSYHVFHRVRWKKATTPGWPGDREPYPAASKHTIGYASDEESARRMCREWNNANDPGKYSRRAEYEAG